MSLGFPLESIVHTMNPRFWCFDLELNQPSGNIIQIGGLIGNIYTEEVYSEFSYYIDPGEPLNPAITTLTGITTQDLANSVPIGYAWEQISSEIKKWKAGPSPITWGGGDLWALKKALAAHNGPGTPAITVHREYDLKTLSQYLQIANRKSPKGGLSTSMSRAGLMFEGRQHNALTDARNTFKLAVHLVKGLRRE